MNESARIHADAGQITEGRSHLQSSKLALLFQGVDDDSFAGMQSKSMAPTGLNSVSL